jgi:hypothetical protein
MVASLRSPLPFHLANSVYLAWLTPPAGGGFAAAGVPLPACDRGRYGSLAGGPPACLPRDKSNGAVQAHGVVVIHVLFNQLARILFRQRCPWADAFSFERLVPTLDLAIGLRIVRRRSHMGHPGDANKLLEIPCDELRSVIGDNAAWPPGTSPWPPLG